MFYAALGDSMSIDDYAGGPGRGAASLLYRNDDHRFPAWAGRDLATAGFRFAYLARDGATSADVLEHQLGRLPSEPLGLATLTMGGNDILVRYGDTAAAMAGLDAFVARGDAILHTLRQRLGDCPLLVNTIYDPSDGAGAIPEAGLADWPEGLTVIAAYNEKIRELGSAHGAVLVDLHALFTGHGLMTGNPAQLEAEPSNHDLWYCGVVEPNAWGAHAIRRAWHQAHSRH
ncbi:SGNH/GDSL hydrolase family protein [Longispora albida]|uniref:SGNH/GDSL hydrolase family protein n=1 Tax=Longispora albida TaxID=203523 RepID=UPI000382958E|nr:SGNH/GDSL hydrolase family protein [Longispora albida]